MHDLILVDGEQRAFIDSSKCLDVYDVTLAPVFHLVIQEGSNGEVYNMAIRGTDLGGSDGIDVWGETLFLLPLATNSKFARHSLS